MKGVGRFTDEVPVVGEEAKEDVGAVQCCIANKSNLWVLLDSVGQCLHWWWTFFFSRGFFLILIGSYQPGSAPPFCSPETHLANLL